MIGVRIRRNLTKMLWSDSCILTTVTSEHFTFTVSRHFLDIRTVAALAYFIACIGTLILIAIFVWSWAHFISMVFFYVVLSTSTNVRSKIKLLKLHSCLIKCMYLEKKGYNFEKRKTFLLDFSREENVVIFTLNLG